MKTERKDISTMNSDVNMQDDRPNFIACLICFLLPALMYGLFLLVMHFSGSFSAATPMISDELFWFRQITGMVDSGRPLGYFGYNGTHAAWGTFGPWGPTILLPYALFGKLLGFEMYSMSYANVTFLCLALGCFALMVRLSARQLPYVAISYAALLLNVFYAHSAMAEPLRWSLAILLAGCMIRIQRGYAGKVFAYLIVPVFLLFACQAYMLLTMFVPVYLYLVLPFKKVLPKICVTGLITLPYAYIMRKLLMKMVSPLYGTGVDSIYQGLSRIEAIRLKLTFAAQTLFYFTPQGIWRNRKMSDGFPSFYLILVWAVFLLSFIVLIVLAIRYCRKKSFLTLFDISSDGFRKIFPALLSVYLLFAGVAGYALIYRQPTLWTVCRGIHTMLCCSMLLLSLYQNKKATLLIALLAVLALPGFYGMSKDTLERRTLTSEELSLYEEMRDHFEEITDISPQRSTWENTIAQYGGRKTGAYTALALAFPRSAGINVMRDPYTVTEAGYAVVFNSFSEKGTYEAVLGLLKNAGYHVIYEHEVMTMLSRVE